MTVPDTFGQVRTPWDRLRQDRSGQNRIVFSQTLGLDFKIQNLVCQYQPGLNRTFTSRLVLNRINGLTELRCSAKLKICYWSWSCHNFQIKTSLGPGLENISGLIEQDRTHQDRSVTTTTTKAFYNFVLLCLPLFNLQSYAQILYLFFCLFFGRHPLFLW